MRRVALFLLMVTALACGGDDPARPPLPQPPAFSALSIAPDTVVTDTLRITVVAERADRAVLRVDDVEAVADSSAPFVLVWDSKAVDNGPHDLTILAVNQSGFADTTLGVVVDNPGGGVVVTVSPEEASLASEETVQFTASVLGTENHAVTWTLWGGIEQGPLAPDSPYGSVDSTGLYTAPTVVPANAQFGVRATSVEDPNANGTAVVNVTQAFAVVITAAPLEVILDRTYQLQAQVFGAESTLVDWSLDEGPSHGTIDEDGLYTAPSVLPDPPAVTFRATSHADSAESDSLVASMIEPLVVTVTPDSATVSENGLLLFKATVEGADDDAVVWTLVEGRRYGSIDQTGLYIGPSSLPNSPRVTVRARSIADGRFTGTATVDLVEGPPAGEAALFAEMYATGIDAIVLSEQITGIVGTALELARSLSGNPNVTTGTLSVEEELWSYEDDQTELLVVDPETGPTWSIRFTAASGGMNPPTPHDYAPGMFFYGHLDCIITVDESELHLSNLSWVPAGAAKPGDVAWSTQFTRSLEGSIPVSGRDGWTLSLSHDGVSDYSGLSYGYDHRVAGTMETPTGLSVALEESLAVFNACTCSGQVGRDHKQRVGSQTVQSGGDTYVWHDMATATYYEADAPTLEDLWQGAGTVTKNGAAYGEISLAVPLPLGLDDDLHPTLMFAHGHRLILLIPPLNDPPWEVQSPFEK